MAFDVIKPGLLSTLQDEGRFGYRKHGVIVSGPMDAFAHRAANVLVGNPAGAATLEMTWIGPQLIARSDMLLAICGGDLDAHVDGEPAPLWRPWVIPAGSMLELRHAVHGCRAYLAVGGGFCADEALGSRSTYVRAGIGGFAGRALQAGDRLDIHELALELKDMQRYVRHARAVSTRCRPPYADEPILRIVRGREQPLFREASWAQLLEQVYVVTPQSDRMGFRLAGEAALERLDGAETELVSEAVAAGTLQVPPSGQPLLLLADCQTTGGYPRIGHVITADLPLAAQVRPGGKLRFAEVTLQEAQEALLVQQLELRQLAAGVSAWRRDVGV
ncbi:biotin-dependent carboxyltransferase family protein [Paenibacillus oryzisoli]|uniref:5-oxoprolinase subunit C family protein n=1 Tax=Paenibacillus oryzisoli TaxID=1850517 RepID=UPI003D2C6163